MIRHGRFSLERIAEAAAAAPMRRALSDFLDAVGVPESIRLDVITAVGEALANAIEHAYRGGPAGEVRIVAFVDGDDALNVQVVDRGTFVKPRTPAASRVRLAHRARGRRFGRTRDDAGDDAEHAFSFELRALA